MSEQAETAEVVSLGQRKLTPITRETVNDKVYAELRRTLIQGVFANGETLRIADLAEKFQTSTMPVRDALSRLVSEQALEALPNRSVRVPLITRASLEDLSQARCLIEGQVLLLAMPQLTDEDFATLRALTRECEAAFAAKGPERVRRAIELNYAFHNHIYRAAGSRVLIPMIESLWLQSGPFVHRAAFLHDEKQDPAGTHYHWELIDALERRDPAAALAALNRDITRAFNLIRAQLDSAEPEAEAANDA
ncbi:MAG: GntR family transcriptional regulator [Alphaproteobacteria bacterium]|nr:GntR family transcriptional regulator [Alphaproteobacteria bacterium]